MMMMMMMMMIIHIHINVHNTKHGLSLSLNSTLVVRECVHSSNVLCFQFQVRQDLPRQL